MELKTLRYIEGNVDIEILADPNDHSLWMNQKSIADLFGLAIGTISKRLGKLLSNAEKDYLTFSQMEKIFPNGKHRKTRYFSFSLVLALGDDLHSDAGRRLEAWLGEELSQSAEENPHPVCVFEDEGIAVDVTLSPEEETVWLTQTQIAALFEVSRPNVAIHIQNVLNEGELGQSTCKEYLHVAQDGKQRQVLFYNLDMILAVGYRVRSKKATEFHFFCDSLLDSSTPFLTNPRNRFSF